jgi:hypothetical protein
MKSSAAFIKKLKEKLTLKSWRATRILFIGRFYIIYKKTSIVQLFHKANSIVELWNSGLKHLVLCLSGTAIRYMENAILVL